MKNIKLFLFSQLVLLLILGCNKIKDGVGEPENAVYINESLAYRPINFSVRAGATVQNSLALTPRLVKAENHNVEVAVGVDNGLVVQYNEVNGTNYEFLPEKYYAIPKSNVTIPANSVSGGTVAVNFNITDPFPRGKLYLLPVTITNTSGLPIVNSSKTAFYLIGDNSGGARIVATSTNNAFKVNFTGAPILSNFTFEAMVYGNKFDRLISTVMGIEGSVLLRIGDAGIPGNQMQMVMPGSPNLNTGSGGELSANQWHHVAAVYNGQTVSVYLDGKLAKSGPASGTVNVTNNFYLGFSYDNQRYIDGMMCEARVWSIARTQQELIANKDYVSPETTGLLAYWSLDDNTGNVAIDKTGHGYNATSTSPIVWVQSIVK
ncbi:DUF1735 and LamG domain-containing protein [Pedobacter gandavensis]|uniref:DUF1735 and LamG domain-containing protein n=1 Tax=Pedobacter gandavensis TaxID=2679963 RepID=UPI00292E858F|nr:DUF1735 and LamG domain-containing protein [Pedobacter gandavensis]